MTRPHPTLQCPCDGAHCVPCFRYDAPPEGEVRFDLGTQGSYNREVLRCKLCAHYVSVHDMDVSALYSGEYVDATYGDDEGLRRSFVRINSLPEDQSDNVGRVQRIVSFAAEHFGTRANGKLRVLDVGSGLCVFLHRLCRETNWKGTALDPDPRSARHARETVGVAAVCGDFLEVDDLGRHDVIAFNKVLEHVKDPVDMLARAQRHLEPGGFIYIELPDGEAAAAEGPGREEFFIDHHHVFSGASLLMLATRAGFQVAVLERLREPSTKFTLRAFLVLPRQGATPI